MTTHQLHLHGGSRVKGKNTVYLIRCNQSGLHKIGITGDWDRRSRELEVGSKTTPVRVVRVNDGRQLERWLHTRYKAVRLPQTEYFQLSSDDLQHVLSALDETANDRQQAVAKRQQAKGEGLPSETSDRQGVIKRPEWEHRVWTDQVSPEQGAAQASSGARTIAPPRPSATPAADNAAAWREHEDRMRKIREQQAGVNHEKRTEKAFPGWYVGCFAVLTVCIAGVLGSNKPASAAPGVVIVGAINAAVLAFPAGYALAHVTTRRKP